MKRVLPAIFVLFIVSLTGAQTTIDKPAATIKLSRQEVISVRQLKGDVERLEKASQAKFTPEQIKQVLDARINSLLFVQFCEREKIVVSDNDLAKALSQMKSALGPTTTDADLEASLRASGVFVEPKVYIRQRLLFENYVTTKKSAEMRAALTPPTADDILKAYDLARASLVRPDTMRVSILYADNRAKSDADVKKQKEIIQGIASALNKTIFGAELFDAVFKLKTGDISPMVESPTGYRIVRANEFLPQKQLGLSDTVPGNQNITIQEFLMYQLAEEKEVRFMDSLESELIKKLRTEASIRVFEENLKW
ncbi:MAG: parvulin-like peptidyl-prolyl isomerase [Spirochaetes bacterium]|nr:MAG: parvulin-like peptidyl-prolyl isomerase [Spirochaetota bacterium]